MIPSGRQGAFLEAIQRGSTTYMDEVDVVVPRRQVNTLVEYIHSVERKEAGVRIKSFGHTERR